MRERLFAIFVLAVILCILFPGSPAAVQNRESAPPVCLLPPEGLELPVGQGIGIRCRLQAESPATIAFLVDDMLAGTKEARPGGTVTLGWVPQQPGSHTLATAVRTGNRGWTKTTCRVLVVPSGSPVRIPPK
jgi:hypothetical protein